MTPGPITVSPKYVIKNYISTKSNGLGITVGTNSVTFTNLQVGQPFVINIHVGATLVNNTTFSGATVIQQVTDLSSADQAVTLVGIATVDSVTATFNANIGSNYYLFTAYQV